MKAFRPRWQQHVERFNVSPLDGAHGFGRLFHGAFCRLGETLLGRPDHFNHFLSHKSLLRVTADCTPCTHIRATPNRGCNEHNGESVKATRGVLRGLLSKETKPLWPSLTSPAPHR